MWALHGSVVELHVGGADQKELEQQGLSNLVGRDLGFIMLAFERLCCLWNAWWTGNPRVCTPAASWVSASSSWRSQEAPCVGAVTSSGHFMEEIDTHVLRIIYGIWVGKIVFLIFRICVNNYRLGPNQLIINKYAVRSRYSLWPIQLVKD